MPKQHRISLGSNAVPTAPYPIAQEPSQKAAAIWSSTDDEILLQARASGLNWQPVATRHFPNKTANACRKRHERLIERRHVDDWDAHKLELLATEYMICRREMWEVLASRLGERWTVVEAKCMEKGFKTLQTAARIAQRKATASYQPIDEQGGISDHNSDSGIGFGSEAEMETGEAGPSAEAVPMHTGQMSERAETHSRQEHGRSRSLPQPLPFYYPPQPVQRTLEIASVTTSPHEISSLQASSAASRRCSPESQSGRITIQSVLSG
ncbi:Putative SANT/Myb domain, Homeobox-like domain superfamily protein [Septoria linicola]|uniref:SANT/Myb domain, Homeobox-like domain superfamily protein n=1 Tax=Septoria linicola TaxID=215465 RepID=A0A9Q9AMQ2_9PEZI|nr:Putative SANT/Myb domain, Homeobox-like domain superfamily protein [Septoria linicola]